jgi:chemotaxis protein CheY-P-specific phosphatase CheC
MNSGSTNIQMQAAATTLEQLTRLKAVQVEMPTIQLKLNFGHKFDESMRHPGGNQF